MHLFSVLLKNKMNLSTTDEQISFCGEVISILDNEGKKSVNIKIEQALMKAEFVLPQEIHLGDKVTLKGRFIFNSIERSQLNSESPEID